MSVAAAARTAEEFDVQLPSGRIHAQRFGRADAPLVIGIPGVSANMKNFDFIGERLSDEVQLVAFDPRGRGRSERTAPGTYGYLNHACDVFALADALGAGRFKLIGHSMGAGIAMTCAHIDASRIERMVLIDTCGPMDPAAAGPIVASGSRLGTVYPSLEAYLSQFRQLGVVEPWNEYWQRYYEYDMQPTDGGVASTVDRMAAFEDGMFYVGITAYGDGAGIYALWPRLTMPVLLLRAMREMLPGIGYIVREHDVERFRREVPAARIDEIDANHYTIAMHPDTPVAIDPFLHQP
ncbi:MAG: alpha/beta hydrolase [Candidatus Dormibacteraeota bacterium]|nr:alpha/beta hydrolase [Candidatus Dormibacteraeota bacterium]